MASLRIKQNRISIKNGNVVVDSPELINELIHNADDVLGLLSSSGSKINLADISINDEGRVVIDNPDFRKDVEGTLSKVSVMDAAETNGICGIRC
ncbi:hypothetical protein ACTBAC_001107 [Vibrio parahaemolyticus]|uniref:hypothetical protein n=1 Tax=Vibrio campbellii TaxID=680 RepID=UPI0005EDD3E3|nr:hypothetical protein [Vibrio campbellii]EHV9721002.1 hypothetical protein [Vibrio parahaemolyticus]EJG0949488.1 hypothetical protein [Vibrio parahaemolyticus O1:K58]EKO7416922.1 hypothetical protein [Vibrio parahaemolyticus]